MSKKASITMLLLGLSVASSVHASYVEEYGRPVMRSRSNGELFHTRAQLIESKKIEEDNVSQLSEALAGSLDCTSKLIEDRKALESKHKLELAEIQARENADPEGDLDKAMNALETHIKYCDLLLNNNQKKDAQLIQLQSEKRELQQRLDLSRDLLEDLSAKVELHKKNIISLQADYKKDVIAIEEDYAAKKASYKQEFARLQGIIDGLNEQLKLLGDIDDLAIDSSPDVVATLTIENNNLKQIIAKYERQETDRKQQLVAEKVAKNPFRVIHPNQKGVLDKENRTNATRHHSGKGKEELNGDEKASAEMYKKIAGLSCYNWINQVSSHY